MGPPLLGQAETPIAQATPMTRNNVLHLVIGTLTVAVVVLTFQLYQAKQRPAGPHVNLGDQRPSIESK